MFVFFAPILGNILICGKTKTHIFDQLH
jgi:hypothetical protein